MWFIGFWCLYFTLSSQMFEILCPVTLPWRHCIYFLWIEICQLFLAIILTMKFVYLFVWFFPQLSISCFGNHRIFWPAILCLLPSYVWFISLSQTWLLWNAPLLLFMAMLYWILERKKRKKRKKSVQSDFSYSLIFVIENIKYKIHFVVEMQFLLQTQNN